MESLIRSPRMRMSQVLVLLLLGCGVRSRTELENIPNKTSTTFSLRPYKQTSRHPYVHSSWHQRLETTNRIFTETTKRPFVKMSSSQRMKAQYSKSSNITALLTYCDTKSICAIKWDTFVPYLFYSGNEMQLTNQIPLNNFNFTRLDSEITEKGDGAVIAGYAVVRAMALFDRRFRFVRTLQGILNEAGFTGERRKRKSALNHFLKKGNFELAWEDFSMLEPKHIRRSYGKRQSMVWRGAIHMDSGERDIKVAIQNGTRPTFLLRMPSTTIKIKYGYSRKTIKTISKNPFRNFTKLSQKAKHLFYDIFGDFSIFFIHEYEVLSKKCVSDTFFTFEKLESLIKTNDKLTPKSVHDIVKFLKSVDTFDLFEKRNKFCQAYQITTPRIRWGLGDGIGAW